MLSLNKLRIRKSKPGKEERSMTAYGQIYHRLRKNKNVTLQNVARDTGISSAAISRFEHGINDITLAKLGPLLAAIHVTRSEFFFEYDYARATAQEETPMAVRNFMINLDMPFDPEFLNQSEYSSQDADVVLATIARRVTLFHNNPTQYNLLLLAYYQALYAFLKHTHGVSADAELAEHNVGILQHYLLNVEDWGVFEIELFISASMFFSPPDNLQMLRIGYRKSQRLAASAQFRHLQFWLLASDFTVLLARHDLPGAAQVLTMLQQQKSDITLDGNVRVLFFTGWLSIAQGAVTTGEKICRSAIAIFRTLHDSRSERIWQGYLERILKDPTDGLILLSGGWG